MQAKCIQVGMGLLLMCVMTACGSSESKGGPGAVQQEDGGGVVPDAGAPDAGAPDSGTPDAGTPDAGADGGVVEAGPPCEKTHGVCAGAKRAKVDGVYESVCTALSYGGDYEGSETRCDGLDNDCDGVTDPPSTSRVAALGGSVHGGLVSSLRTETGVWVAVLDSASEARILRLDSNLVLQGSSGVPYQWTRTGGAVGMPRSARLVRTAEGPALYYATTDGASPPLRGYLVPLDGEGAPRTEGGGALVEYPMLDREFDSSESFVAASPTGERVVVLWRAGSEQAPPLQVMGKVTDARGQVLVAPKVLFESTSGGTPYPASVLWLRNGEVLVAMGESQSGVTQEVVRVRRLDEALEQVGEERVFTASESPMPLLVDRGEAAGEPLVSPVLVMRAREAPDFRARIQVTSSLFEGGMPATWTEEPEGFVPWYGAHGGDGVVQLSWLSKVYDQGEGGAARFWGRLWAQEPGVAAVERTPALEPMWLTAEAQWVLMEKVAPRRMAAMYMVSTDEGLFLDAVRYCTQ
ncbi:putative metal-binding motif-containing protein [Myxococcus sp. MISCRS1]|uniref:putative metal-binding motif-containing protein n=1 Tax=Myxococcus sp. MISCRS1 TaxID=2996786 RepID=UPI00226F3C8A|nr:putative metal-binding motif-containing protein [Myxococcus sp. MISCRS1]MCY0999946.1 putative metal-binding motif-containing protein [Myxococcus sp. MISCRS1]